MSWEVDRIEKHECSIYESCSGGPGNSPLFYSLHEWDTLKLSLIHKMRFILTATRILVDSVGYFFKTIVFERDIIYNEDKLSLIRE
jgi:hypothetical protein